MITGSCHCGSVRFELRSTPEWLTRCNCSLCCRIGGLWAAADNRDVTITHPDDALNAYVQGDATLALQSCRICGCTTHYTLTDPAMTHMKVNLAMAAPETITHIRIRNFDGADTWAYID